MSQRSAEYDRKAILEQRDRALASVASWPQWKKELLVVNVQVKPMEPKTMSEAERRELMHTLADGKECWIEWLGYDGATTKHLIRGGADVPFEARNADVETWYNWWTRPSRWLSWSVRRLPQVWEGTWTKEEIRSFAANVPCERMKCRIEEVVE